MKRVTERRNRPALFVVLDLDRDLDDRLTAREEKVGPIFASDVRFAIGGEAAAAHMASVPPRWTQPGAEGDRELASDVRTFLAKHQRMNATPEVFAARHAQLLNRRVPPIDVIPVRDRDR